MDCLLPVALMASTPVACEPASVVAVAPQAATPEGPVAAPARPSEVVGPAELYTVTGGPVAAQPASAAILAVPTNTTIHVVGVTNSGLWPQWIVVQPQGSPATTWQSYGSVQNKEVGTITIPKSSTASQLTVRMLHDPGDGPRPSTVHAAPYEAPGLAGWIVGGQDSGGRPNGPAYWNTVVFVYWAPGY